MELKLTMGRPDRELAGLVISNIKHTMSRRETVEVIEPWWPVRRPPTPLMDKALGGVGWVVAIAGLALLLATCGRA